MKHTKDQIQQLANCLRFLSVDGVQKAVSGHPGMPLGMADITAVLFANHIKIQPQKPHWINRDRFILSNGHGSMLLYAMNHLAGYDLSIEDLQSFRQLHSKTPGHPEHDIAAGVETTTGPLGQGLANAVGMAMAAKHLGSRYELDHNVYCFVGDGCLMEGISQEAISLAGTWCLDNLIVVWDDNGISIDGQVDGWFNEDIPARFRACHWEVITDVDGHDIAQIDQAFTRAKQLRKPVLIQAKTTIGHGLLGLAGSAKVHGAPAGDAAIKAMRSNLNWSHEPFVVPQEVKDLMNKVRKDWDNDYENSAQKADKVEQNLGQWHEIIEQATSFREKLATRSGSQKIISEFQKSVEPLMVGSADLTASNLTDWSGASAFSATNTSGRYVYYGVREFGMFAIANGLALSGMLPVVGTFLTFMDYGRNAMRLAAMMKIPVTYVLTHDSCGLGEDGPTHQPVEHLSILRNTPGLSLWRPASLLETAVAWQMSLQSGPSALALSRQKLYPLAHHAGDEHKIKQGAYVLYETGPECEVIIFSCGSEVAEVMENIDEVERVSGSVRVVSVPCMDLFFKQSQEYQAHIVAQQIKNRIVYEAGSSLSWYPMVGSASFITIESFGVSAPGHEALAEMGISIERLCQTIEKNKLLTVQES